MISIPLQPKTQKMHLNLFQRYFRQNLSLEKKNYKIYFRQNLSLEKKNYKRYFRQIKPA
jgi:hypothetical protein